MFSFGIVAENFEVFENGIFECKVCGWQERVNGILLISSYVCSALSRSISWARCLPVVTVESG